MTTRRISAIVVAVLAAVLPCGCDRLDMYDQPRYEPLEASSFFADGMSARPRVEGTVARGEWHEDEVVYTGRDGDRPTPSIPASAMRLLYDREQGRLGLPEQPSDDAALRRLLLERGRERYDIYCSACHGRLGTGAGIVVARGFRRPPTYDLPRLRDAPAGHFFDVITHGVGAMPAFGGRVDPLDRWAITAYLRVLQMSRQATLEDVPADRRDDLDAAEPRAANPNAEGSP